MSIRAYYYVLDINETCSDILRSNKISWGLIQEILDIHYNSEVLKKHSMDTKALDKDISALLPDFFRRDRMDLGFMEAIRNQIDPILPDGSRDPVLTSQNYTFANRARIKGRAEVGILSEYISYHFGCERLPVTVDGITIKNSFEEKQIYIPWTHIKKRPININTILNLIKKSRWSSLEAVNVIKALRPLDVAYFKRQDLFLEFS